MHAWRPPPSAYLPYPCRFHLPVPIYPTRVVVAGALIVGIVDRHSPSAPVNAAPGMSDFVRVFVVHAVRLRVQQQQELNMNQKVCSSGRQIIRPS